MVETDLFFIKIISGMLQLLCFTLLCFSDIALFFFNKFKVYGNPASIKPIGTIFPIVLAHFMSICYILVIITIFQFFFIIILLWWSVTCMFEATIVIVWGHHKPHLYTMANLIDKFEFFHCSTDQPFPSLCLYPQISLFPETQQYCN